jgi:uncharacterized membrane protein
MLRDGVGHDHGVTRGRLEAFSDGVVAILITIMVLELTPPNGASIEDLVPLWPVFLACVLSFANLAIYRNNHHHLFGIYIFTAATWIVPDPRIERRITP